MFVSQQSQNQDIFAEFAKVEFELKESLENCSNEALKMEILLKRLIDIKKKYQNAKAKSNVKDLRKYYNEGRKLLGEIQELAIRQREELMGNLMKSINESINSLDVLNSLDRESIKK